MIRELSRSLHRILYAFKFVLETFQNNNVVKYDIYNIENPPLITYFKGLFLGIHENMGLFIEDSKTRGCPLSKKGGL